MHTSLLISYFSFPWTFPSHRFYVLINYENPRKKWHKAEALLIQNSDSKNSVFLFLTFDLHQTQRKMKTYCFWWIFIIFKIPIIIQKYQERLVYRDRDRDRDRDHDRHRVMVLCVVGLFSAIGGPRWEYITAIVSQAWPSMFITEMRSGLSSFSVFLWMRVLEYYLSAIDRSSSAIMCTRGCGIGCSFSFRRRC